MDLGNKVDLREEDCSNMKEENTEKGVKRNQRGRERGKPKKVSNLEDGK